MNGQNPKKWDEKWVKVALLPTHRPACGILAGAVVKHNKATDGLPNHQTSFAFNICTIHVNLQHLLVRHEILYSLMKRAPKHRFCGFLNACCL